jgi:hypothetical protein
LNQGRKEETKGNKRGKRTGVGGTLRGVDLWGWVEKEKELVHDLILLTNHHSYEKANIKKRLPPP